MHEVNPADPDVDHAHRRGHAVGEQAVGDSDAEPVVAVEDVSDAGHDDPHALQDRQVVASDVLSELEDRLRRYPEERYPIQHATAQFHRGIELTNRGRLDEAADALGRAERIFDPGRLPVEHAKTLNALGAVLRLRGQAEEAAALFERAAAALMEAGQPLDAGAARFNLGLARRDAGDEEAAIAALEQARDLLDPERVPAQAAAAARELGAILLAAGDPERALPSLEGAVRLAEQSSDRAGLGAAANALGLARLATGDPVGAIDDFRSAVVAHPRTIRPAEHAMAKANLALAHEAAGDERRARIAAAQARTVAGAPDPVARQAEAVLDRLGRPRGDLMSLLDAEPPERWPGLVRDELLRLLDEPPAERDAELGAWVGAEVARLQNGVEIVEAWLATLLELPPPDMETLVRGIVGATGRLDPEAAERVRADVGAATARFHMPQLLRLEDAFDRCAVELGQRPWS